MKVKNIMIEYHSSENYDYSISLLNEIGYTIINSLERYSNNKKPPKEKKFVNGHIIETLWE